MTVVAEHEDEPQSSVAISTADPNSGAVPTNSGRNDTELEPDVSSSPATGPAPAVTSEGGASPGEDPPPEQPGTADPPAAGDAEVPPASAEEVAAREAAALERAEALKKEGNELFGRGQWDEAAAKYNAALDEAPASCSAQRSVYFSNLGAANIKQGAFAAAVQHCTAALELEPGYQKALMRRCEAFERLDELDHALTDAKKLLELDPDSAWARAKVAALQPVVDERTEKLKAEMLGKLKDLGNSILGKFGMSVDNFKFDKDPNSGSYSVRFER
ncbi:hypothetical protein HYH03_002586 [Edaphochlamys debaryana]|uniref:Tetratricopeptide repeat protein 1 n=1 Tax=Edaphochlamys debaryana TaxID=47281 RepID=A0A836C5E5_9CHLO|nr:hypothetical protein HYH03_002586 [Edaphochlamys debaryana]|eukprot:KAG2499647.1 hypothetical protein HYH03_002586 [Edaphochlamys debaryana]